MRHLYTNILIKRMKAVGARRATPLPSCHSEFCPVMPNKQTASQMDPCRQVLYACLNNLLNKQAENTNKSGFMEG